MYQQYKTKNNIKDDKVTFEKNTRHLYVTKSYHILNMNDICAFRYYDCE